MQSIHVGPPATGVCTGTLRREGGRGGRGREREGGRERGGGERERKGMYVVCVCVWCVYMHVSKSHYRYQASISLHLFINAITSVTLEIRDLTRLTAAISFPTPAGERERERVLLDYQQKSLMLTELTMSYETNFEAAAERRKSTRSWSLEPAMLGTRLSLSLWNLAPEER